MCLILQAKYGEFFMQGTKKKVNLVMLSYALYLIVTTVIGYSSLNDVTVLARISQLIKAVVVMLLFLHFLLQKRSLSEWIWGIFLLFSALMSMVVLKGVTLIPFFFLFLLCSREVDFSDFIRLDIKIRIACIAMVMLMWKLGLSADVLFKRGAQVRHTLGFTNPNTLAMYIFIIIIEYLFLRWQHLNFYDFILILCIDVVIYFVTGSRTSVLVIAFSLIVFYSFRYLHLPDYNFLKVLLLALPSGLTLLLYSIMMSVSDTSMIYSIMNKMTSNRLYFYMEAIKAYGFSWFGQITPRLDADYQATQAGWNKLYLDNSYLSLGVRYGVITLILFIAVMTIIMYKAILKHDHRIIALILLFCVYGLAENLLFKPQFAIICMMGSLLLDPLTGLSSVETDNKVLT